VKIDNQISAPSNSIKKLNKVMVCQQVSFY